MRNVVFDSWSSLTLKDGSLDRSTVVQIGLYVNFLFLNLSKLVNYHPKYYKKLKSSVTQIKTTEKYINKYKNGMSVYQTYLDCGVGGIHTLVAIVWSLLPRVKRM